MKPSPIFWAVVQGSSRCRVRGDTYGDALLRAKQFGFANPDSVVRESAQTVKVVALEQSGMQILEDSPGVKQYKAEMQKMSFFLDKPVEEGVLEKDSGRKEVSWIVDKDRMDWLEERHTLHWAVEFVYVVDGYLCELTYDGNVMQSFHGTTIREAIDAARANIKENQK